MRGKRNAPVEVYDSVAELKSELIGDDEIRTRYSFLRKGVFNDELRVKEERRNVKSRGTSEQLSSCPMRTRTST